MSEEMKQWYVIHLNKALESRCFDMDTRQWVKRLELTKKAVHIRLCIIAAEHGEQALLQSVLALQAFEQYGH